MNNIAMVSPGGAGTAVQGLGTGRVVVRHGVSAAVCHVCRDDMPPEVGRPAAKGQLCVGVFAHLSVRRVPHSFLVRKNHQRIIKVSSKSSESSKNHLE